MTNDFQPISETILSMATSMVDDGLVTRVMVFHDSLPEDAPLTDAFILVARKGEDSVRTERDAEESGAIVLEVPDVDLDRAGQVNLAALLALSAGTVEAGERVVCLVGERGKLLDTMHVLTMGDRLNLLDAISPGRGRKLVRRAVFQRVVSMALSLAEQGREGKRVGAFFVVGDTKKVAEYTEQLIINPFRGYPEDCRNILDAGLNETVKEFSTIDGAFVIRGDGVIESAGTLIRASLTDQDIPSGLGARHAAAAGITHVTSAVAVTVSESDGTVRVWRKGKIVTALERAAG